jgi:UDP-glucose 4-epimerase
MKKKKILITGGLGNLGSWITEYFIEYFDVDVLTRNDRSVSIEKPFNKIFADLTDLDALKKALNKKSYEYIIHAGSVNDYFVENYNNLSYEVNAFGTRNLINAIDLDNLEHFIYLSTFQVYGSYSGEINEDSPTLPKNDYGMSHLFAEKFLNLNMPENKFSIIRLTNSYGCPKDLDSSKWYLILNDLAKMAYIENVIKLNSNGESVRDFIWMGDVSTAFHRLLITKPNNEAFNLSRMQTFSSLEIANQVNDAYHKYFNSRVEIQINEDDTSSADHTFKVCSRKIRNIIEVDDNDFFKNEAIKIFRFLEN